jgi:hypothetical protein
MADLAQPTLGNTLGVAQDVSTTPPTLVNGNTITTSINGVPLPVSYVTNGGAVTGIIVQAGVVDNQPCTIVNIAANSVTMAAVGTSNVADGTSAVIAALTRMNLVWSATQAKWYHGN